jgi:hypothetical protein
MINLPERTTNLPQPRTVAPPIVSPIDAHEWWCRTVGLPQDQVKVRLRGNNLYVLCEAIHCPDQKNLRSRVIRALAQKPLAQLLPPDSAIVYQVTLYGKAISQIKPEWAKVIHLEQVEAYATKLRLARQAVKQVTQPTLLDEPNTAVFMASHRQLAEQGMPEAIARHLSEFLSQQGIAVRAGMKALIKDGETLALRRLVIHCEAAYSPDPAGLIEPIAAQLRELKLTSFRDAVVYGQVQGETTPEWKLRIDLTPPEAMLRDWARWGDLEAIVRLSNQVLETQQIAVGGIVLDMILHMTAWRAVRSGHRAFDGPDQAVVVGELNKLLEQLSPQGIHGLCLYGATEPFTQPTPQAISPDRPVWEQRSNLAAATQVSLADTTEQLARQGDLSAIGFLLTRLLNPELAQKLSTGGRRVQARHRDDLLHIMVDGPTLPAEKTVVPLVAEYLQSLKVSGVNGVRIYGRRGGEVQNRWKDAIDFVPRQRLVPEATPEFAASDAYVGDLITQQTGSLVVRPELNADELWAIYSAWINRIRQILLGSQIFAPIATAQPVPSSTRRASLDKIWFQDIRVAAVWGSMGLLLTLCADWSLAMVLPRTAKAEKRSPQEIALSGLNLNKSAGAGGGFNQDGFTGKKPAVITAQKSGQGPIDSPDFSDASAPRGYNGKPLLAAPVQPKGVIDPSFQTYETFNTPQLNEKVALYEQFVAQSGVPDVLVVGSSRAMRGIDPVALQDSLTAQGYSRKIFNFGINGATAQVVDLVVRRLIAADKLPKLIIWADGARAMNSGRPDLTYSAIATSPGYAQLQSAQGETTKPVLQNLGNTTSLLAARYQAWNTQLNQVLAKGSAVYPQRSQFVDILRDKAIGKLPPQDIADVANNENNLDQIDVNGFLPLSVRYNPTTYYQKYARVTGANDADYSAFQLQGQQTEALKSVSTYIKAKGTALVFVNLPLTADYLDVDRQAHEASFQQFMIQSAASNGFTYRNLGEKLKTDVDYFSDPSHMNRYGAHAVSELLAQDPLIPWGAQ